VDGSDQAYQIGLRIINALKEEQKKYPTGSKEYNGTSEALRESLIEHEIRQAKANMTQTHWKLIVSD